ncbi:MAG: WG repeat-containing protein [Candidatus Omnitrophota bacterium]
MILFFLVFFIIIILLLSPFLIRGRFVLGASIAWGLFGLFIVIALCGFDVLSIIFLGGAIFLLTLLVALLLLIFGLIKITALKKQKLPCARVTMVIIAGMLPSVLTLICLIQPHMLRNIVGGRRSITRSFFEHAVSVVGYSPAGDFSEGLALVRSDTDYDGYGYIDKDGTLVFTVECDFADSFSGGRAVIKRYDRKRKKPQYGYIDAKGNVAIDVQYDDAQGFAENLATVKIAGRWGYIDMNGAMVIAPQFDRAFSFSQGRAKVVTRGRSGFIDASGAAIVKPQYYKVEGFSQDRAVVCDATKCGYIDTAGNVAIALRFDDAKSFAEGFASVKVGAKWHYVDTTGNIIASDDFDSALPFSEGYACVSSVRSNFYDKDFGGYSGTRGAYAFIDTSGKYLIAPKLLGAESFASGLALVKIPAGDFFGECEDSIFINTRGKKVTRRFTLAHSFKEGLAFIKDDAGFGFINTKGDCVIRFKTRSPYFNQGIRGRSLVYGYIDSVGTMVIPAQYHAAASFSGGLSRVDVRSKRQFINQQGEVVFGVSGSMLPQDFSEGLAVVGVHDTKSGRQRYGYLDEKGNFAIAPQFYAAGPFSEGLAAVKFSEGYNANNWGYIDRTGKVIIEPKYYEAGNFHRKRAFVQLLEERTPGMGEIHSFVIDNSGKPIIDFSRAGFDAYHPGAALRLNSTYVHSGKQNEPEGYYSFGAPLVPVCGSNPYKIGYIDSMGAFVVPPRFDDARPFSEGLAAVKIGTQWGYIDERGTMLITPMYDAAGDFSEQRAVIERNGKYGYIDQKGTVVVEPQFFEEAFPFSCGRALIKMNGQYGFIDSAGTFVIEPRFDEAFPFQEGMATVGYAQ